MINAMIVDIETCPIDLNKAKLLDDEDKLKLLNPIDSKIVAIGIRYNSENSIFQSENEVEILEKFWLKWKSIRQGSSIIPVVGFNIVQFDIPFIVSRSFINNITISPFTIKEIIDLREKINAYRYGKSRGKLKEFAQLIGMTPLEIDGSQVMELCINKDYEKLKQYLEKDLEITEKIFERASNLNITQIRRW
jgi:uncharacterized protein YprB with RNaseH-like and TPR domain